MILDESEIRKLTGKERPSAQGRALSHLGIPFKRRPDGSLVVSRAAVERALCPGDTIGREPQLRLMNG